MNIKTFRKYRDAGIFTDLTIVLWMVLSGLYCTVRLFQGRADYPAIFLLLIGQSLFNSKRLRRSAND